MLKKCACGGGVGPEGCKEGRGAKAKPRGCTERRGRPAEQRWIKDTKLNHRPCLRSPLPLTLIPYFQKDQHEGKQQSLHYCCYHSQTAIFQAEANLGTLVYDVYAWTCMGTCILLSSTYLFIDLHMFTCAGLAHCELYSVSQWVQSPLAALPSAIAQLGIDLAGQWPLWALVPSPHWCDEGGLCPPHPHPWPQRWGGTQGTRWLASEATFTQLTRPWLAALKVMVPGCLAHCCPLLPCTAGRCSTTSSHVSIFPSLSLLQYSNVTHFVLESCVTISTMKHGNGWWRCYYVFLNMRLYVVGVKQEKLISIPLLILLFPTVSLIAGFNCLTQQRKLSPVTRKESQMNSHIVAWQASNIPTSPCQVYKGLHLHTKCP